MWIHRCWCFYLRSVTFKLLVNGSKSPDWVFSRSFNYQPPYRPQSLYSRLVTIRTQVWRLQVPPVPWLPTDLFEDTLSPTPSPSLPLGVAREKLKSLYFNPVLSVLPLFKNGNWFTTGSPWYEIFMDTSVAYYFKKTIPYSSQLFCLE